jgi:hypothetical protein
VNFIYLDSNSLSYAFRAGGTNLLDKIYNGAVQAGYSLRITDAVALKEIASGPQAAEINAWNYRDMISIA